MERKFNQEIFFTSTKTIFCELFIVILLLCLSVQTSVQEKEAESKSTRSAALSIPRPGDKAKIEGGVPD
jgi:uncharacterized protein YcnI